MGFMDKLGSAANTAKWKADQQMRIMRTQNNIHDLENQIKTQKMALGDAALGLYAQGCLSEEPLRQICMAIGQLGDQIAQLNGILHEIQAEQPPVDGQAAPQAVSAPAPAPMPQAPFPAPVASPAPVAAAAPAPQASVLVCPVCGQTLKGRFCPEHGKEGIPAN